MELNQTQVNMVFGSVPESSLNYLNYLGANLEYDVVSNSIVNHANGFRIANLARIDIAQDILDAFRLAKAENKSEQWFADYLTPTLKAKGWWHTEERIDPETGEIIEGTLEHGVGSPARLALIYENLTNTLYSISHYIRMRNVTEQWPYWRYHAIDDSKTREEHAKLRGKIFRWDDPIWDIIYPPNGHRCRCSVENLTEADIKNGDLVVLKSNEIINGDGRRGVSFMDENGQYVEFYPDAGFDYNPAISSYEIDLNNYELELAQSYIDAELNGAPLEKMYNDALSGETTNESVNAAIFSDDDMNLFGLHENTIKLNQSTLSQQMQNKTLLPLENLQQLQTSIMSAPVVLNYRGAICFCEFDGAYWRMIGVNVDGDIRVIANLTDDSFNAIVESSTIIRGSL